MHYFEGGIAPNPPKCERQAMKSDQKCSSQRDLQNDTKHGIYAKYLAVTEFFCKFMHYFEGGIAPNPPKMWPPKRKLGPKMFLSARPSKRYQIWNFYNNLNWLRVPMTSLAWAPWLIEFHDLLGSRSMALHIQDHDGFLSWRWHPKLISLLMSSEFLELFYEPTTCNLSFLNEMMCCSTSDCQPVIFDSWVVCFYVVCLSFALVGWTWILKFIYCVCFQVDSIKFQFVEICKTEFNKHKYKKMHSDWKVFQLWVRILNSWWQYDELRDHAQLLLVMLAMATPGHSTLIMLGSSDHARQLWSCSDHAHQLIGNFVSALSSWF